MLDYRAISRRHALIPDDLDEDHTLDQILALMLSATPTDMATITLITHDRAEPRAATHALARQADQLQTMLHDGPGLPTDRTPDINRIDHTLADTRWPTWGPAAARLGIGSVLCLPMTAPDHRAIGSITLYAHRYAAFAPTDVEVAAVLARHATIAYLNAHHSTAYRSTPGIPAPREATTAHALAVAT